jgi:hypothetical protein
VGGGGGANGVLVIVSLLVRVGVCAWIDWLTCVSPTPFSPALSPPSRNGTAVAAAANRKTHVGESHTCVAVDMTSKVVNHACNPHVRRKVEKL